MYSLPFISSSARCHLSLLSISKPALALPRVTVGHNFHTPDRPPWHRTTQQIRFNRISVEFGHKQFHQSRNRTAPSYANLRSLEPFMSI